MNPPGTSASVLVPALDEEANIETSMRAMLAQQFGGDLEVLVIDGGSTDRTREIVERLGAEDPRVKLLDNPARRIPNALNIGLREASADYVVRMDAHAHYPPTYIAQGVERLARGDVDLVGGPVVAEGRGRWSRRIALARNTWLAMGGGTSTAGWCHTSWVGRDAHSQAREAEVDNVSWGVWRRSRLVELGGWDEAWPINEDAELAARIRETGGRIVLLSVMAARYVPRDSLVALARQYVWYGQFRAKTARRHPASMRPAHVVAPGLALTAAGAVLPLPRRIRAIARLALGGYAAVLAATTTRIAASARPARRDAAALPLVLATMHLSWGAGYLVGCGRFGPPLRGLAKLGRRARVRAIP